MTEGHPAYRRHLPALGCLAAAAVLLVFANGRWVVSPAVWLAPSFMLLFLDSRRRTSGLLIGFAVQLVAFFINWQEMIPVPGAWYFLVAGIYALFYYLPFVVHRLLAPRLAGFASTLILPSAWVAIELVFFKFVTPYGSWASIAYTQVDQGLLLQVAALAGTGGISFVIVWSASVFAWLWGQRSAFASARRGLAVYVVVMALLLGWGGYRLASARHGPRAIVQVAGITPSARLQSDLTTFMGRVRSQGLLDEPTALAGVTERATRLNDDLIDRTRRAADDGATLVAWSEHAARVMPDTEDALIDGASRIARDAGVGIVLGIGLWNPNADPPFENKLTAIAPGGSIAWTYHKARPIAGNENGLIGAGGSKIRTFDTGSGRVGVAICHDLDFPDFVRSAGRDGVEILIAPSSDWSEIAVMHHRMAVVRAVENGLTLFRPTQAGISSVVDPYGRALDTRREDGDDGLSFIARVPVYDVATLYPALGDWFGYASGVLVVVLVGLGLRRRPEPTGADR